MLKFRCVYPFSGHCKATLLHRRHPMAVVFARLYQSPSLSSSKIAVPPSCHGPSEEGKARYKYKNLPNTVSRTGPCNVPHPVGATSSSPVRYLFVYPKNLSHICERSVLQHTVSIPAWPLSKILPFFLRPGARGRGTGKGDNMNDRLSVFWGRWMDGMGRGDRFRHLPAAKGGQGKEHLMVVIGELQRVLWVFACLRTLRTRRIDTK